MNRILMVTALMLGLAATAPAFAGQGRYGDDKVAASNSFAVVQGATSFRISIPAAHRSTARSAPQPRKEGSSATSVQPIATGST